MKRFDLMMGINTRGTFMVSKYCIPHLKKAANPHILMLSPPLDMKQRWFEHSTAYTMAKFGMSMCVLGLSGELKSAGVAVNALWPRTTIATAAVGNLLGGEAMMRASRTPEIMGDAAHAILTRPAREFTGQFCIDDKVLYVSGVRDFEHYRVDRSVPLMSDFFVPDDDVPPPGVTCRRCLRWVRTDVALEARGARDLRKRIAIGLAIFIAALAARASTSGPTAPSGSLPATWPITSLEDLRFGASIRKACFAEVSDRAGIRRLRHMLRFTLDRSAGIVDVSNVNGLFRSRAAFHDGFGCVDLHGSNALSPEERHRCAESEDAALLPEMPDPL